MSFLADRMISKLLIDEVTTWTPQSLDLDAATFHDLASRVLALATDDKVEATAKHRESQTGNRYWDLIEFKRLE
jgi:hypothetical protein